jgi:crossover junction endodeoxyribonuclease RuvC
LLILGLDPGSRHTGFAWVEARGDDLEALDFGRMSCPASQPVPQRLASLVEQLTDLLDRRLPHVAVLETPFHGLNSRSLVVLAEARGALLATLAGRSIEITEYSPAEIKSAVAGNGRADKTQVARMVSILLGIDAGKLSSDAADALAIAVCYAHRHRFEKLVRRDH